MTKAITNWPRIDTGIQFFMQPWEPLVSGFSSTSICYLYLQPNNLCDPPKATVKLHLLQLPDYGFHRKEAFLN